MSTGCFGVSIENMNAEVPVNRSLQQHQAKLAPAENTNSRCQISLSFVSCKSAVSKLRSEGEHY